MQDANALNASASTGTRLLAASGAACAACAVALSAYAAHGVEALVQSKLQIAAAFAFGHGVALAALAPHARKRLALVSLVALLMGLLFFCGGIVAKTLLGVGGAAAPFGGSLLILAWLLYAIAALRR